MEESALREAFEKLKDNAGAALHVMRIAKYKNRKTLVAILKNPVNVSYNTDWGYATEKKLEKIEKGKIEITLEEFKDLCLALDSPVERGLKAAQYIQEAAKLPPDQLINEILEECEYELWARRQQSGE